MLADAVGFIDVEADAEIVRADPSLIQQAAQQRVLRTGNRMQRSGAVERVGKPLGLRTLGASTAIVDFDAIRRIARCNNTSRDNLQPPISHHSRNRGGNFRGDAVPVNVPPRADMAQELALLVIAEPLPQGVAVRSKAVDRSTPADFRAAAPEPAEERAQLARHLATFSLHRVEIR